ncbi:MAG: hypothetical protein OEW47_02930 [Thermoleophilia bacterium]|nr:hypothetical protein [Thermoleophilia bacterium]
MSSSRSFGRAFGAVATVSLVAVVLAVGASARSLAAPNLLKNGGADLGEGVNDVNGIVTSIPGWTRSGSFTVVKYGAPGGFPELAVSKKIGGKVNFFAGGPSNPRSGATQVVDVSRFKSAIGAGKRMATLSGLLGGYASQEDSLTVTATFLSAAGKKLGVLKIGPVTAGQRKSETTFLQKSASKPVPKATRSILVKLTAARTSGSYNDGYADSLALRLAAT